MILAIDPGTSCIGWALVASGVLSECGLMRFESTEGIRASGERLRKELAPIIIGLHVVCEIPQVYRQRNWKGNPNDLIDVAFTAGVFVGALSATGVTTVRPHAWKGNAPKEIHTKRILKGMSEYELNLLKTTTAPASLKHNVIDAIGLGKWYSHEVR